MHCTVSVQKERLEEIKSAEQANYVTLGFNLITGIVFYAGEHGP
jgi:hypothetical protein